MLLLACLPVPVLAMTENFVPVMGDYVFFTFVISAILFSSAILIAMGAYRWLVYGLFAALMVLSTAASGGVISYIIGPTDFNLFVVPYLIVGGFTTYGFWMAGWLLDDSHSLARYRRWYYGLAIAAAIGPLTSYFWLMKIPLNLMWLPCHILYFVMIFGQILPPLTWQALGPTQHRLVLTFPIVITLFLFGSGGAANILLDLPQDELNLLSRISVAVFLSFSLLLVLWQAFATARARQAVEHQAMEAAKNEAELQLALVESEKQYERARVMAAQQRSQLEKVTHDLKQPISALRMAVGNMDQSEEKAETLNRAVDYVDQLAQSFTTTGDARGGESEPGDEDLDSGGGARELVTTHLFAESLEQMFADEARNGGVDLSFRCQEAMVRVRPLAALRVFTNVLTNALAHANASRVLVTFRRRGDSVVFSVYDNGDGMDEATTKRVLQKGVKGINSEGDGLGLSIVQDLCSSQGFLLQLRSWVGRGTRVSITLS